MLRSLLVVILLTLSCGRVDFPWEKQVDSVVPAESRPDSAEPCRVELPSDSIVRFDFPQQRCHFTVAEAAQGLTFRYGVEVIASELSTVESQALFEWSTCDTPIVGLNIYLLEKIFDDSHMYCECDRGLCNEPSPVALGAKSGRIERTVPWNGRAWFGRSDTNAPFGPPFPAGEYVFSVETQVRDTRFDPESRSVMAKLHFTLSDN